METGRNSLRYSRQMALPQIGEQGQALLSKKRVLVAGAGGLGSVSSLYLAACGIGTLVVADHDAVEISNLNRQILHSETSLGRPKADSARERLTALNSSIHLVTENREISSATIDALVNGADLIVDGTDTYAARKILNRASIRHGIPFVFGGVRGFDGMASVFIPAVTACFECIFKPPKTGAAPFTGIIGPAAGITASIQAMEAVKVLLGIGTPLSNRLIRISGLEMTVSTTRLAPDPDCPACGAGRKRTGK